MASFVLVHGSGQNASCWARVGDLLQSRGHVVAAPELPKSAPTWGLEDYAAEIARSVTGPQAVVVAHSFSGVFLPLIAKARPCALLVFLAAVIPEPGKSVRDQFSKDPGMFGREWIEAGPRWFDVSQRESIAREFLFPDCDPRDLSWALTTVELFDTRHLVTEAAPFESWPDVPTAYIAATQDRTLTADWGRRTSRRLLGREAMEIVAGHCPQVSRPVELAGTLEALATREAI